MPPLNLDILDDDPKQAEKAPEKAGDKAYDGPMNAIYNVPVDVQVVLGRTSMLVAQLLKLGRGAVLELERKVDEPVEVLVNHRLVARGEVVIVEDQRLGVTLTEIVRTELEID
ncbi:flagellar motor switch protein FliN [Azospirillum melinis]|uniref:Flagellar motor switch protein FliN n=2 Tax=Azospirillum TaxID=191 RepID=A0A2B8BMB2_9PROT|nr:MULTISPECIES: flagellar motor switch protein FliN [Azospirillum]MBP2310424.1 flagellar motor switch protein FliN/FliY [Azospirillum melinis]NUB02990.1 flagellar motor switch protein FliN [Azospirillum melinis]PGH58678.1 flagellar motor switch protein FliN [Azospirillum palustre]PWC49461.1 flagellar motor switch protein FliN [Azospirillum sp. TSA6c]